MSEALRNIIITFLVLMGMILYLYIFFDSIGKSPKITDDAVLQFAMTIGVSVSTFVGAWLGIDTKRRLENRKRTLMGEKVVKRTLSAWHYKLQFFIIAAFLLTLVVGSYYYIRGNETMFVQSLFTNATGLMLGALAVVLSPVEE